MGGYLYRWFIDKFNYDDKRELKKNLDTDDLYFIPHFGGRAAPSQPYYKGTWFGMKWNHDLDDFYVALLESLGYEYNFILSKIEKLNNLKSGFTEDIKVIGGGSKNVTWNNIKSNILNLRYLVMKEVPHELLGVFLIARNGIDLKLKHKDLEKNKIILITDEIDPDKTKLNYYKSQSQRYIETVNRIGRIYRDLNVT